MSAKTNGYLYNAEIVEFKKDSEQIKELKSEYECMGFSVRVSKYSSYAKECF